MASGDASNQERTEQPTQKRRDDARRKGQVPKSPDLTAAASLLGALVAFSMSGPGLVAGALDGFRRGLVVVDHPDLTPTTALAMFFATSGAIARLGWPFVAIPAVAAIATQVLQTRFAASWHGVSADWSRVNPFPGIGRMLSPAMLIEAVRIAFKLGLLAGIAYMTLKGQWGILLGLGQAEAAVGDVARAVWRLWLLMGLAYLGMAGFDYGHKWWMHHKSLLMTREEIKEESRETEGNPLLRSRIRALHRQRAARRMMADVRRADVVVRNPTHVAVALRYDGAEMRAPKVVAKGARLMARRIIEAAERHGVPVVENPPLARSLYRAVAIGQEIPGALYRLVAEVLAHVYSLRAARR